MQDDVGRVEEGDARDERQEAVPQREGIARVEAAVRELVHRVERERAERVQLSRTGEVEEPVAADLARDVPEQDAEDRARPEDPPASRDPLAARRAPAGNGGDEADRKEKDERQRQRAADEERDGERAEEDGEPPGERRRDRPDAERPSDCPAGGEHHPRRKREPEERHRRSSSGTRPEPSHAAASRYIRPRSPR